MSSFQSAGQAQQPRPPSIAMGFNHQIDELMRRIRDCTQAIHSVANDATGDVAQMTKSETGAPIPNNTSAHFEGLRTEVSHLESAIARLFNS